MVLEFDLGGPGGPIFVGGASISSFRSQSNLANPCFLVAEGVLKHPKHHPNPMNEEENE